MYESKLQELQKQVETISLVAETPDEEELEEEEEEEGVYCKSSVVQIFLYFLIYEYKNALCIFFHIFCPEPKLLGRAYSIFSFIIKRM